MPTAPKHPCPGRGPRFHICPNVIGKGISLCPECLPYARKEQAKYDKERDQTDERKALHSTQWRKVREMKLAQDPLCERCLAKTLEIAAYLVHHKDHNELNWEWENLESLCNDCHETEHKLDRFRRGK